MIKKAIDIYVPLMDTGDYSLYIGDIDVVIKELIRFSGQIEIKFNGKFISPLHIKKLSKRSKEVKEFFPNPDDRILLDPYIKFSANISISTKKEFQERREEFMSFEFFVESFVKHLLIYLNLAKPGAFDTRQGIVKTFTDINEPETKISEFPMLSNSIAYSLRVANQYKWPPLKELSIQKVLDWLKENWKAFEVISENKIQRALNAFSYLFHDNLNGNSPNDLFHALLGVEAIFVQGNSNIQEQVNQKSQLLLGKRSEFKKVFSELYDFRSRYIHGQLNFINKYFIDDKSVAIDQMLNTYEKSAFAIAILISSIQKHIEANRSDFEYELILK